jgi:hypothetical protein
MPHYYISRPQGPSRAPLPKVSGLLPPDARDALVAASKLPEPRRTKAVQEAIERAQQKYPHLFNFDEEVSP